MGRSQLISSAELRDLQGSDDLQVIDCRFDLGQPDAGRAAYLDSHIPGAVYAHLDHDLAGPITPASGRHPLPHPETIAGFLGKSGVASTTKVVVYDAGNGAMAARAWWLLRWLGHESVRLLDGGFQAWLDAWGATSTGEELPEPKTFVAQPRGDWVITTDELVAAGDAVASMNLFDARDAERYRGEVEPIDTVAGHVPGARNLPLAASLAEDGRFLDKADLEALWETQMGPASGQDWAVMCGSGVTACHLALSGLEAGRAEPRVYIGSWSEWIRDPERPVATGESRFAEKVRN